jgi:hypothetical protein
MFDKYDIWVPPKKMYPNTEWWLYCPVNNVNIGYEPERFARKLWTLSRKSKIPMLRILQMLKIMQFGPKGEDLGWSPDKELKAIRERAAEDAELLALGDDLPFEVLVEIWLRCREGLRLSVALWQADYETKVAHHQGERKASILAMKARELLKKQGPGEVEDGEEVGT